MTRSRWPWALVALIVAGAGPGPVQAEPARPIGPAAPTVRVRQAQPAPPSPRRRRARPTPAGAKVEAERCADPIVGTWRAKVWRSESAVWDRVTVSVVRHQVQLSGWIWVESWDGDADQLEPPTCADGSPQLERWQQRMRGSLIGTTAELLGSRPRMLAGACEPPGTGDTYRPDHFTGEVATDAELLIMTNDDGGVDRGRPHHFQRISCRPRPDM